MTNRPRNLVKQQNLNVRLEHLIRHLVASLDLVLVKLKGFSPVLVPLVTRNIMKVTTVGTRFRKSSYLKVLLRVVTTLSTRTDFMRTYMVTRYSVKETLQETTRMVLCTVSIIEHPPPDVYLVRNMLRIFSDDIVAHRKTS